MLAARKDNVINFNKTVYARKIDKFGENGLITKKTKITQIKKSKRTNQKIDDFRIFEIIEQLGGKASDCITRKSCADIEYQYEIINSLKEELVYLRSLSLSINSPVDLYKVKQAVFEYLKQIDEFSFNQTVLTNTYTGDLLAAYMKRMEFIKELRKSVEYEFEYFITT